MPRLPEHLGARIRGRQQPARQRAVVRRDARGDGGVARVDGDGVGGAVGISVVGDHLREVQGGSEVGRERGADEAGGVADHEGHFFGGQGGGGDDEVAFVFAGGGVEDDDEGAGFCGGGVGELVGGEIGGGVGLGLERGGWRRGDIGRLGRGEDCGDNVLNVSIESSIESNSSFVVPFPVIFANAPAGGVAGL